MAKQKILFVADTNSIHTVKWVDYFVEEGHDVYVATFAKHNKTKCKKVFFLSDKEGDVKGGNYHYLLYIGNLSKVIKEIKPDIINAHYSYSMGLVSLLALKFSKIEASFSVVCHGSDMLAPPLPILFNKVNRFVVKNSDKIFVVSDQIKDKIESFGIDKNIFVGQYGLSTEFKNRKKDIDILSNRTYHQNSRIDFLLDGLKVFKDKNLKIVFVLPTISDIDLEKLKKENPYIEFYSSMSYEEMMALIDRTKVYISATKSDGTSLSLLEALKAKTIPVVSNIVSNRSWVLDSANGFLFNHKDDFVEKIKASLNLLDEERKKMVNINLKIIDGKANYKKQMKEIEQYLLGESI